MSGWTGRGLVPAWVGLAALAVAAPVLAPGYVLSYDAVAVPQQSLLPESLGLGGSPPRAVPAEVVTVALTQVVDGQWVQKALLLALLLTAGLGAAALVPTTRTWVRVAAATVYLWNPFVAERLVLGHWWLLLGYACLPVVARCAVAYSRGGWWQLAPLTAVLAAGSLVPSAGLVSTGLALALVVAAAPPGLARSAGRVAALAAAAIMLQAPWWTAAVAGGTAGGGVTGASAFAARAEGVGGWWASLVSLGGIWNAEVVPTSRAGVVPVLGAAVVLAGAVYGWPVVQRRMGVRLATGLLALGVVGLALAGWTATGWGSRVLDELTSTTSAFGLLRDAQKYLAWWAVLLAVVLPLAAERLAAAIPDRVGRRAVAVAVVALPLVMLPDLAWGVAGRLQPVAQPSSWSTARTLVQTGPASGDALVLPWGAFRRYPFNDGRTSLSAAPRWLPIPAVVDDRLIVDNPEPQILPGESARAASATALLADPDAELADLGAIGVGWVVVDDPAGTSPAVGDVPVLRGAEPVLVAPDLVLLRVPGPGPAPGWPPGTWLVVVANAVAALTCVVAVGGTVRVTMRRRATRQ